MIPIKDEPKSIGEGHNVEPKIDEEEPKIGKSSKRIPGSKKDPQWTEAEWLKYNMEPKIGYMYNRHDDEFFCDGCDKPFKQEFACWRHLCDKPQCQITDKVKTAVLEYNREYTQSKLNTSK